MDKTLAQLFQESKGAPLTIGEDEIRQINKIEISKGRHFLDVARIKSKARPVQGVRIKLVNGTVSVTGHSHPEIILWADTSPDMLRLELESKSKTELRLWNVWRVDDLVQAWVGNSGMRIKDTGAGMVMECSDGNDGATFDDLVVRINLVEV